MKLLNIVELTKNNGYCSVEIYNGDITKIGQKVDLLIVSAFNNSFNPVQGTVMGALYNTYCIDFNKLFENEKLDLRESLNCWITNKHNTSEYGNILVIEIVNYRDLSTSIEEVFRKLFIAISVLEQLGTLVKSIAMTSLGTGMQNLSFNNTITALVRELKEFLKKGSNVERILFIENDKKKSIFISEVFDTILNRMQVYLPVNDIVAGVKTEILQTIQNYASTDLKASETYKFIHHTFNSDNSKSVIYGIACRRLTEKLLDDLFINSIGFSNLSLFMKIKKIADLNVAKWVISYLHVVRIFGNESAHDIGSKEQIPKTIEERDLSLLLFCMQRIVDFWMQNKKR